MNKRKNVLLTRVKTKKITLENLSGEDSEHFINW